MSDRIDDDNLDATMTTAGILPRRALLTRNALLTRRPLPRHTQ